MTISNWQHELNRKSKQLLEEEGFTFDITANGYTVKYNGVFVGGGSVMLPRTKPLHYKHRDANIRDNLASALVIAQRRKSNK